MNVSVFDLHCDTPVRLYWSGEALVQNSGHIDLQRAEKLEHYTQFFSFCCVYDMQGKQLSQPYAEKLFLDSFEAFQKTVGAIHESPGPTDSVGACNAENLKFVILSEAQRSRRISPQASDSSTSPSAPLRMTGFRSYSAERAIRESPLRDWFRPLLSLEGTEAIDCDPARLEWLHQQGFCMTTLTWNYRNALAGSCMTGEGLTDRGREFVREAQRLGITIDVSHLSERAFWDLVDITTKPIVASHSNSRACCNSVRNLTDDQFRAIRDLGGLVGMNLYAPFLRESGEARFDDVRRHLDHWLSLDGGKTVALGADLDGCDRLPEGFSGVDDYNHLGSFLLRKGYDDILLSGLFCHNASAFFGLR